MQPNGHIEPQTGGVVTSAKIQEGYVSHPEQEETIPPNYAHAINVIAQWRRILNVRVLAMLSLLGALVIFGFTIADPVPLRLWGASFYAVSVLWPSLALFFYRGNN